MTLGSGIAVLGIWTGIGMIGWHEPGAGAFAAIFGTMATAAIVTAF